MSRLLALTALCLLPALSSAQILYEIDFLTSDSFNAGMDFLGHVRILKRVFYCFFFWLYFNHKFAYLTWFFQSLQIDLEIFNDNFQTCLIDELDTSGNTFEPGHTDIFTGDELKNCQGFYVPNCDVPLVRLTHSGSDAWKPQNMKLYFDLCILECPINVFIDSDEIFDVTTCHEVDP